MASPGRPATPVTLTAKQIAKLEALEAGEDPRLAKRASIVLAFAGGKSNLEIAEETGMSGPTISTWRHRFLELGIPGLSDRKRPGRPRLKALELSQEQREVLTRWSRRRRSSAGLAQRARAILLAAEGLGPTQVAERVGCSITSAGKWRQRFEADGLSGLSDEYRPGRPRSVSDEQVEEILKLTLEGQPSDGSTHWSSRSMSRETGLSHMTIARIWKAYGLKPHRFDTFKLSTDPNFVDKVHDVVGLYLDPPERAVVLCVDEKTGIQALDRTQPAFPILPGSPARATHDYIRNGTVDLFAALNVGTGSVICRTEERHRAVEFRKFLNQIDKEIPTGLDVHVILDNASIHKTPEIKRWLKRHPRFHFHFTPTSSSWLNLVERWFAELTNKKLKRSAHANTSELVNDILTWAELWSDNPKPFVWTKTADQILNSLASYCERISVTGH